MLFFIAGFVLPLIVEYRRLGTRFKEIETTYLSNRHRQTTPPREEVLVSSSADRQRRRQGAPISAVMICAIIGAGLLGFDIIDLIVNMPASEIPSDRISNF